MTIMQVFFNMKQKPALGKRLLLCLSDKSTCPPLLIRLLQSMQSLTQGKRMRWGKEKEYSPTFSGPISSAVKSEVKVIQSLKMLPCLTFHDPDLLTSLLNVVKEEYVLTTPLAFLASEHFFLSSKGDIKGWFQCNRSRLIWDTGQSPLYPCPHFLILDSSVFDKALCSEPAKTGVVDAWTYNASISMLGLGQFRGT